MPEKLALPRLGDGRASPVKPSRADAFTPQQLQSEERRVTVLLNVYSLVDSNKTLGKIGMGVFHTGVVLYGIEWGYGECLAHPEATGLFLTRPGTACGTLFRTVNLGVTTVSPEDVDVILHQLEREWRGGEYHILDHNCNHFAQTFCDSLSTVERLELPPWCNRAARVTNRVVPRRLATKIKNMMDPPDAKEKYLESAGETRSVIPANWFTHPSVFRAPKNVPPREHEARRVTHSRATRSFTSITSAFDDMASVRTDDAFDFDDAESCCSRVLPLASVELQPQMLDPLRLRRRSSSISMSTDCASLHSTELTTRKARLGPRGRGGRGARGGGRARKGADPLTLDASTTSREVSVRHTRHHFAAPTEASLRRERLSSVQQVEARGGRGRGGAHVPETLKKSAQVREAPTGFTVTNTTTLASASATARTTGTRTGASPAKPTVSAAQSKTLMANRVALLGEHLSDTAGPLLESPILSDITSPSDNDDDDDSVEMGSTSPTPALVLHSKLSQQEEEKEEKEEEKKGTGTDATAHAPQPRAEEMADDYEEDDFPFFRHIDPSLLASPVGILMVKKSRRRAQSIQERKEMLLRVVAATNQTNSNNGGGGDSASGDGGVSDEAKSTSSPGEEEEEEEKKSSRAVLPAVESNSDRDPLPSLVVSPPSDARRALPMGKPFTSSVKSDDDEAATAGEGDTEGGEEGNESGGTPCVFEIPRRRIASSAVNDSRTTAMVGSSPPRRHTVSTRIDLEVVSPMHATRPTAAMSLPARRTSASKVHHLPPMDAAPPDNLAGGDASASGMSTAASTPPREPFIIQSLATKGFAGMGHSPGPQRTVSYPRRGSLPSLPSRNGDGGLPGVLPSPKENVEGQRAPSPSAQPVKSPGNVSNTDTSYPQRPCVVRQRSPSFVIEPDPVPTPGSLTGEPIALLLVEKPSF